MTMRKVLFCIVALLLTMMSSVDCAFAQSPALDYLTSFKGKEDAGYYVKEWEVRKHDGDVIVNTIPFYVQQRRLSDWEDILLEAPLIPYATGFVTVAFDADRVDWDVKYEVEEWFDDLRYDDDRYELVKDYLYSKDDGHCITVYAGRDGQQIREVILIEKIYDDEEREFRLTALADYVGDFPESVFEMFDLEKPIVFL